jgi:hypothetical protein
MDIDGVLRDTRPMVGAGASQQHLAGELNAAYSRGLISQRTLTHRLDLLFGSRLIEPARLVGDLSRRLPRRRWRSRVTSVIDAAFAAFDRSPATDAGAPARLLALNWTGGDEDMLLGRHPSCEILLDDLSVSRRHARLFFRDGSWVIQDLGSTNGTRVNDVLVGRCELHPGDQILLGDERLRID